MRRVKRVLVKPADDGTLIPNSQYVRRYCDICGEPMRCKVDNYGPFLCECTRPIPPGKLRNLDDIDACGVIANARRYLEDIDG